MVYGANDVLAYPGPDSIPRTAVHCSRGTWSVQWRYSWPTITLLSTNFIISPGATSDIDTGSSREDDLREQSHHNVWREN